MANAKLSELGQEIFMTRYAYPGETRWAERAKVIAKEVASAETDEEKARIEKAFYDIVGSGDFIPGGRIIYGSGRNSGRHNLLNCYVIIPEDSVESIGKTIQDMYKISCAGGGIGFNVSKIRPKGADIGNVSNSAPGSVSVLKMINELGEHVRAGKNRRTALMGILDVTHPDLFEFLHVKLNQGELNNFNISVAITNRFIEAVEHDEEWYFHFNNKKYYRYTVHLEGEDAGNPIITYPEVIAESEEDAKAVAENFYADHWSQKATEVVRTIVKAREIWTMLWKNAIESGDPGIYNRDLANSYTNVSYFESLDSTNPCITGDTLIATADGRNAVSIKQLEEEGKDVPVYSTNL